ncbi:MAG: hypothetical protein AB7O97_16155 [Planctomycetota bacterium]
MTEAERDLPEFPPEAAWLELEPPPIGDDFVGRTMAVLRDAGALPAGDEAAEGDGEALGDALPRDLLAAHAPPPVSAGFVGRTLTAAQQGRADQWRRLLLRYDAPAPTPDFVARTLRALGSARPSPTLVRRRSWPTMLLAAAAALLLLFALRPDRTQPELVRLALASDPSTAAARSPAVLSHLLAPEVDDDALPMLAADGGWLWLAAAEAGR